MPFDFSQITQWVNKTTPSAGWSVAIIISTMLWGPSWLVDGLGLEAFIKEHRQILGVSLLLSLVPAFTPIWRFINTRISEFKILFHGKKYLKDLRPAERVILGRFINEDTKTLLLSTSDGVAMGLVAEHIIRRAARTGHLSSEGPIVAYNILPWAWNALRDDPALLE